MEVLCRRAYQVSNPPSIPSRPQSNRIALGRALKDAPTIHLLKEAESKFASATENRKHEE